VSPVTDKIKQILVKKKFKNVLVSLEEDLRTDDKVWLISNRNQKKENKWRHERKESARNVQMVDWKLSIEKT